MELICAKCNKIITPDNINVATDLAKCGHCHALHKASELVNAIDEKALATPLAGSKIQVRKRPDDIIEIFLPKKGVTISDIPMIGFNIFYLIFIFFWTLLALQGSIIFAMFSIPIWFVGLSMLINIINAVQETQTIKFSKEKLILKKNRPVNSKTFDYQLREIELVKMKNLKANRFQLFMNMRYAWKLQFSFGAGIEMPAIITGQKTEYFFEETSDAEQEWITKLVNVILKNRKISID